MFWTGLNYLQSKFRSVHDILLYFILLTGLMHEQSVNSPPSPVSRRKAAVRRVLWSLATVALGAASTLGPITNTSTKPAAAAAATAMVGEEKEET